MHPNEKLITTFYTAFKNSDSKAMIACYHPDIEFSDPVFPNLKGKRAKAMWGMLCQRKADPNSRWFENVKANDKTGTGHWEAKYNFPSNGRPVHNKMDSQFTFQDGLIVRQVDYFNFYAWSRMAFGPAGVLLGWTPFFQKMIQKKLGKLLDQFIAAHPEFQ